MKVFHGIPPHSETLIRVADSESNRNKPQGCHGIRYDTRKVTQMFITKVASLIDIFPEFFQALPKKTYYTPGQLTWQWKQQLFEDVSFVGYGDFFSNVILVFRECISKHEQSRRDFSMAIFHATTHPAKARWYGGGRGGGHRSTWEYVGDAKLAWGTADVGAMRNCRSWIEDHDYNPPRKLTWNLKMMVSYRNLLFQAFIFRFHVNLPGCIVKNMVGDWCQWILEVFLEVL